MTAGLNALVQPITIYFDGIPSAADMQGFGSQLAQDFRRAMQPPTAAMPVSGVTAVSDDPTNAALDRQIDAFRDQLRDGQVQNALAGFNALLQTAPATISGKNLFRIKANIGHCYHQLGQDDIAADYLLAAFDQAPLEPKAIANKTLALLLQRRAQEAYDYARAELAAMPDNEPLAAFAVQAGAHLPAVTDPFAGIPLGLRERRELLVAEIFFYQRRNRESEWIERARGAARRFHNDEPITLLGAQAEVHAYIAGRAFATTYLIADNDRETLTRAAERLQAHWDRRRGIATPPSFESIISAVDAMLGWHLAHTPGPAIAIAEQIIALGISDRTVMVNVGQVLAANDQHEAAQRAFSLVPDAPEARWVQTVDAVQRNDWRQVGTILDSGDVPEEERCVAATFQALVPLMGSRDPADDARFDALIDPAREDARALIAVARSAEARGFSSVASRAFQAALRSIGPDAPKEERVVTANYARSDDNPTAVIDLLEPIIPIDHPSDALIWLAEAHASEAPRRQRNTGFFNRLPAALKRQPPYATQYANYLLAAGVSGLAEAITVLKQLREDEPTRGFPIIQLAQAYRRQNDMEAFEPLCRGIDLPTLDTSPLNRAYIAQILRDGGRPADAQREALAALRAAPDHAKIALAYVGLLIGSEDQITLPVHTVVAEDTYVCLEGPNGGMRCFVIDRGGALPGITVYPPDHALASQLLGKAVGDAILEPKPFGPDEEWIVAEIKDKYLHVLHTIMDTFEERFAGDDGLARVNFDTANPTPFLQHIREYAEARRDLARVYTEQHLPLEFAARMMGGDVLSFAGYLASLGKTILTTNGSQAELNTSITFARDSAGRGAVLDTYTACLAATFKLLPALTAHFGSLVIASTTIDMLDDLILRQRELRGRATMTMFWANGRYGRHILNDAEIDETIAAYEEVKAALAVHATIVAGAFPDDANAEAAALAVRAGEAPFYPMFLAAERSMIFLSEDLPTRVYAQLLTGVNTLWLQPALAAAAVSGSMTAKAYAHALAELTAQRHSHIAINTQCLAALFHDSEDGSLRQFRKLSLGLGGANAEFTSHVHVVAATIYAILHPLSVRSYAATGVLLENLIKGRDDYASMLGCLAALLSNDDAFQQYLPDWITGHFLPPQPIADAYQRFNGLLRRRYPARTFSRTRPLRLPQN